MVGRDIVLLLAFCPWKVQLAADAVFSDSLDFLSSEGYSESLGRLKKEVQACIELLRKQRLTVAALLRETAGNVAYTTDSVFMKVYTGFYVGAKEQEKLFTFAKAENFDIVKQSKRRALVNGSVTLLETVRIDDKFQLNFVDQKIIDSFPKRNKM